MIFNRSLPSLTPRVFKFPVMVRPTRSKMERSRVLSVTQRVVLLPFRTSPATSVHLLEDYGRSVDEFVGPPRESPSSTLVPLTKES